MGFRQGFVPDQVESISRCEARSAPTERPARQTTLESASRRGRKSKSSRRKLLRLILGNTEDTFFLSSRRIATP